jgi:catechol 2,3-dioxygenase-like lactoylglutathione lyase family enzyme
MKHLFPAAFALALLPAAIAQAQPAAPAHIQEGMVGPAIYVTDPARSLKFYVDALGLKQRMRFGPADRPDTVVGFGSDPTEAGIMLITDKQGPVRAVQHGHGFDRIALRLPGLSAVNARLRAAGFQPGEIMTVHGAVSMMMVTDPDGYRIELIDSQPPPKQP